MRLRQEGGRASKAHRMMVAGRWTITRAKGICKGQEVGRRANSNPQRAGRFCTAAFCLVALIFCSSALHAQAAKKDAKDKPDTKDLVTAIKIIVTAGPKDLPVSNASVYIRYADPHFLHPNSQIELDLKTDLKGTTELKGLPRKRIIVQVVKSGWQPFGKYYDLTKAQQTIKIQLKTPPHWY